MMRLTMTVWWSLALVWLLTGQADAEPANEQRARRVEIKGYGLTVAAAKKDATRKSLESLQIELRQLQLPHWEPTDADVQAMLEDTGQAGEDVVAVEQLPPSKTWVVHLKVPSEDVLRQLDRRSLRFVTAAARMSLTLRVLAALALGVAVTVGSIHLNAWTQSRYTNLLRVTAAGVLAGIIGAGWWWLR